MVAAGNMQLKIKNAGLLFAGVFVFLSTAVFLPTAGADVLSAWREIRLIVVAPSEFIDGRADREVVSEILSTVSAAELFFIPLKLRLKVSGIELFSEPGNDPYFQATSSQDAFSVLYTAQTQWSHRLLPDHDAVVVLGGGKYREIFGLSYTGSSCTVPTESFLFASKGGKNDFSERNLTITLAHELGHFLGMDHDDRLYQDRPSLMHSSYGLGDRGLSSISISQYRAHVEGKEEGSSCFSLTLPPPQLSPNANQGADFKFLGGKTERFKLAEGQRVVIPLRVLHHLPGVQYRVQGLPPGAKFDALKGELLFLPDFTLVDRNNRKRRFEINASAWGPFAEASKVVLIDVYQKNRAPRFLPITEQVYAKAGELFTLPVHVHDDDVGDRAIVRLRKLKTIRSFGGEITFQKEAHGGTLRWRIPPTAKGMYEFQLSATDKDGKTVYKTIRIEVQKTSQPVFVIGAKESLEMGKSVWPKRNSIQAVTKSQSTQMGFFENEQARWRSYDCSGTLRQTTTFGEGHDALSLILFRGGMPRKTIYRVLNGIGHFYYRENNAIRVTKWGSSGDLPVSADFDGDGNSEFVIYRPSTHSWHALFSNGQTKEWEDFRQQDFFGILFPFASDIDGDGKDERIIFERTKNGEAVFHVWFDNQNRYDFIVSKVSLSSTVIPFVIDVDGDRRGDFGIVKNTKEVMVLTSHKSSLSTINAHGSQVEQLYCGGNDRASIALYDPRLKTLSLLTLNEETGFHKESTEVERVGDTPSTIQLRRGFQLQAPTVGDTDNDGKTNYSVWRFAQGEALGFSHHQREVITIKKSFGFPVSGSFYQGKRSEQGLFADGHWISSVGDGELRDTYWGQTGDVPVAADYNGDGLTDFGVFRPKDGSWWILFRNGAVSDFRRIQWGASGSIPVPGDYDGDSSVDIAVWSPVTGVWSVRFVDGSVRTAALGGTNDLPMPGDYNGDGVTDFAVWRYGSGVWAVKTGENKLLLTQWGLPSDIPIAADINGDKRRDFVVFRPETATWFALPFNEMQKAIIPTRFGRPGDFPGGASLFRIF